MVVEGAGTAAANGVYLRDGDFNDSPLYTHSSEDYHMITDGFTLWYLQNSEGTGDQYYSGAINGLTPDLVEEWGLEPSGTAPAPTVRRVVASDF